MSRIGEILERKTEEATKTKFILWCNLQSSGQSSDRITTLNYGIFTDGKVMDGSQYAIKDEQQC